MSIYFFLFWSSLLAVAFAAHRWGEWPERAVAALYVGSAVATALLRPTITLRYQNVEVAVFLIDVCLFCGLAVVALRADRWWPLCATALQVMTLLSHVGKAVNPHLWRYGYQLMAVWAAWPMVGLLALGIWRCHRRRTTTPAITSPGS